MPRSGALLSVRGLVRSFYGVRALSGVDFDVRAGTITALIGPNGAGKTTAFQCISGVVPPDGGRVLFAGQDITGWRPDRITRAGLTRTFQIARGIPRLSVIENLLLYERDQPGEHPVAALFGGGRTCGAARARPRLGHRHPAQPPPRREPARRRRSRAGRRSCSRSAAR